MFEHTHPYPPFNLEHATKLIVGTLPPPRFTTGDLLPEDVDFCYGSKNGMLWPILDQIFDLNLVYENTAHAIEQRSHFLKSRKIGVCDIVAAAQREKVEIVKDGNRRSIKIGKKIQGEIEMLQGASPEHPVMVSNTKYWMGPDVIAARGLRSRVRDYGRVWDFDGKSAEICPIHWHGPR